MDRRILLMGLLLVGLSQAIVPAYADGGNGGGGGSGGGGNSGSGNSGSGGGGDDNDDDEDDDDDDWDKASSAADRGDISSLPSILKIALASSPGKVIDVKLLRQGRSFVYRVKILTKTGRKIELSIDAKSRVVTKVK
jgi:hypothetical protein